MNLRPFVDADTDSVSDLFADCYSTLSHEQHYSDIELEGLLRQCTPAAVRSRLTNYVSYVAEVDGILVGFLGLEENDVAELFVLPQYQHRGIGTALFRLAEQQLRSLGHEHLTVHTATAPDFYRKMNAVLIEERTCDNGPLTGRPLAIFEKALETQNEAQQTAAADR